MQSIALAPRLDRGTKPAPMPSLPTFLVLAAVGGVAITVWAFAVFDHYEPPSSYRGEEWNLDTLGWVIITGMFAIYAGFIAAVGALFGLAFLAADWLLGRLGVLTAWARTVFIVTAIFILGAVLQAMQADRSTCRSLGPCNTDFYEVLYYRDTMTVWFGVILPGALWVAVSLAIARRRTVRRNRLLESATPG